MIRLIKSIFCKHKFEDKCKVITYDNTIWQERCPDRVKFGNCKGRDRFGNTFAWYCDYYYVQCAKCGKIIKKYYFFFKKSIAKLIFLIYNKSVVN